MNANDDSILEDLVAEYVDRCESGERLTPESFVATHPESSEELLAALKHLSEVDALLPSEPTGLPDRIGDYVVHGELGRGGMGLVLDVTHVERPEEPIALKVLSLPSLVDARAVERFRREGEMLERFRHESVVEVLEVGAADGVPYMAMSRVDGDSLATRLARARRDGGDPRTFVDRLELVGGGTGLCRAAALIAPLARAVAAAHEQGFLHRDIKPGNIVLRRDGTPVLLDFGLASAADASTLTRTGDVIGTPQYMAPEQAQGRRVGPAADVYGLGTVLYEMTSGRPPHLGTDSLDVLERVRSQPAARLGRVIPDAPRDLETILMRALAFEPEDRYSDAAVLAADLEAFAAGRGIVARRPSLAHGVSALARRHRRGVLVGATMILLLGVAAAAWWDRPEPRGPTIVTEDPFHAALIAWLDGDEDGAAEGLRAIASADPEDERAAYLLARIEKRGHVPAGDAVIGHLVSGDNTMNGGHVSSALRSYGNAADAGSGSALAAAIVGLTALEHGALAFAERELERARGLLPDSRRLREAIVSLDEKRAGFAAQLPALAAAVEAAPDDVNAVRALAEAHYKSGDTASAMAVARRAASHVGAGSAAVLIDLGKLLDLDLRHSAAQEAFREVLSENPDSGEARYGLAFSLDIEHKARAAAEQLEELVRRRPRKMLPLLMLANIYSGANRGSCARCDELYEQHPGLLDPQRTLRYCRKVVELDDQGQHARVIASFARRVGVGEELRPAILARIEEYEAKSGSRAGRRKKRYERALATLDESNPNE